MRRRGLAWVVAAAVSGVGVARGDPPPRPPSDHPPVTLSVGESWRAPEGGGLCLDREAWTYQVEVRRYYEARVQAGEAVAERSAWKGVGIGFSVGLAVGGLVALVKGR